MRTLPCAAALLAAAGLLSGCPVLAQVPPVDVLWSEVQQLVAQGGGSLSAARLLGAGNDWRAEEVLIGLPDGGGRIALPALRLHRTDQSLTLVPEGAATLTMQEGRDSWRFEIAPEGGDPGRDSLTVSYDGTTLGLGLDFGAQRVALLGAWRGKESRGESFEGRIERVRLDGGMTLAEPYSGDVSLTLGAMDYRLASPALGALQDRIAGEVRLGGLELRLAGAGIHGRPTSTMDAAFAAGLMLRGSLALQGFVANLDQTSLGQPIRSSSVLDSLTIALGAEGGRASADLRLAGVSVRTEGALLNGAVALDEMALRLMLPLMQTPDPQPFESAQAVRGLTVSPELLALARLAPFGGLPLSVETETLGQLRWLRPLGPDLADSDDPPLDLTQLTGRLGAAVGPNTLSVRYDLAFPPGALARMGDGPPQTSGTATIELIGGRVVLARLAETGLVPREQLGMAQMVMGALGRPVGDDHLVSDIEIRADGSVLVNGMPAPF